MGKSTMYNWQLSVDNVTTINEKSCQNMSTRDQVFKDFKATKPMVKTELQSD
jgi:hypothetical protein